MSVVDSLLRCMQLPIEQSYFSGVINWNNEFALQFVGFIRRKSFTLLIDKKRDLVSCIVKETEPSDKLSSECALNCIQLPIERSYFRRAINVNNEYALLF